VNACQKCGRGPGSAHGDTALTLASRCGHAPAIRALVQAGADVHHFTAAGATPLHAAAANGHVDAVRILLMAGACATFAATAEQVAALRAPADGSEGAGATAGNPALPWALGRTPADVVSVRVCLPGVSAFRLQ